MASLTANGITRRKFIKSASAGALAFTFIPSRVFGANDRLTVAHVGVGGMGGAHVGWFSEMADVDTAALCDVEETHLAEKMASLRERRPETRVQGYDDFRRVLDRDDIDAVTIATPDHWHALIAIEAFKAGKDVYGEKPLSYCPAEALVMLDTMNRNERIFQLGTQVHSRANYPRIVELVRSGMLGKIHTARIWKSGGSPGLGFPAVTSPPDTLNWNFWLGPAPFAEYQKPRCHRSFRYFLDYSSGVYGDFWCHIADVVFWALEPKGLKSIAARGEPPFDGIADAPAWIDVDFEFEDLNIHWTTEAPDVPGAAERRRIGAYFEGTKGSLICDYETREIRIGDEIVEDLPEVAETIPRSPGHQRNFVDCVRSREHPVSNLPYARRMILPMHLGLISYRLKRKLYWDDEAEKFIGDEAADYLLSRPYRAPWRLT